MSHKILTLPRAQSVSSIGKTEASSPRGSPRKCDVCGEESTAIHVCEKCGIIRNTRVGPSNAVCSCCRQAKRGLIDVKNDGCNYCPECRIVTIMCCKICKKHSYIPIYQHGICHDCLR